MTARSHIVGQLVLGPEAEVLVVDGVHTALVPALGTDPVPCLRLLDPLTGHEIRDCPVDLVTDPSDAGLWPMVVQRLFGGELWPHMMTSEGRDEPHDLWPVHGSVVERMRGRGEGWPTT